MFGCGPQPNIGCGNCDRTTQGAEAPEELQASSNPGLLPPELEDALRSERLRSDASNEAPPTPTAKPWLGKEVFLAG